MRPYAKLLSDLFCAHISLATQSVWACRIRAIELQATASVGQRFFKSGILAAVASAVLVAQSAEADEPAVFSPVFQPESVIVEPARASEYIAALPATASSNQSAPNAETSIGVLMPESAGDVQSTLELRIAKRPWLIEKLMGKKDQEEADSLRLPVPPRNVPDPPSLSRFGPPSGKDSRPGRTVSPPAGADDGWVASTRAPLRRETVAATPRLSDPPAEPRSRDSVSRIDPAHTRAARPSQPTPTPTKKHTDDVAMPRSDEPRLPPPGRVTESVRSRTPSPAPEPAPTLESSRTSESARTSESSGRRRLPRRDLRLPAQAPETGFAQDRDQPVVEIESQTPPKKLQPLPSRRTATLERMPEVVPHGSLSDLPATGPSPRNTPANARRGVSSGIRSEVISRPMENLGRPAQRGNRGTDSSTQQPDPSTAVSFDYAGYPVASLSIGRDARRMQSSMASTLSYYYTKREIAPRRSNWGMMHAMMVYGADTRVIAGRTNYSTIAWIAGNNACRGQRVFEIDSRGLSVRNGPGLQGHQGQLMAIFALCGVPKDYPIYVDGKKYSMEDVIKREMADCKSGEELTFTLIGLSHYLPTDTKWRSADGQSWSLERLIQEELSQPIVGAACGGTHRLMGFAHALRNRRIEGQPINGQWARAEKFTEDFVQYAYKLQNRDGSMSTDWFEGRADNGKLDRKIQTTGHMVEWLLTVTPDDELQNPRLNAATNFLLRAMSQGKNRDWSIGPKGHALRSLAMYYERVYRQGTAWQSKNIASQKSRSRR